MNDKLFGLWEAKDKNNESYFRSSKLSAEDRRKISELTDEDRLVIFKNSYKKEDKHPDYICYLSKPKQQ